jgi:hypothetical protein
LRLTFLLALSAEYHLTLVIAQRALHRDRTIAKGFVRKDARQRCKPYLATLAGAGGSFANLYYLLSYLPSPSASKKVASCASTKEPNNYGHLGDLRLSHLLAFGTEALTHPLPER